MTMQKKPSSSFCAGAAIAAVLALGSTGALAQDISADVSTVAPPAPVTPAPAQSPVMTQTPVIQAIPVTPAAEAAPATRSEVSPASQPRQPVARTARRGPAAAAVPAAVTPPRVPATAVPPTAVLPVEPLAPVALPEATPAPVAAAQPVDYSLTGGEAGLLGLLAIGALGGAALLVAGSRRRRLLDEGDSVEVVPPIEAASVAAAIPAAAPEPVAKPPASPERFAMPAGPVPTGAERDELLRRMVAAPPDEANPFVSRKRRVHRARILLAERERELRDRSTEPFDWRTYRATGANAPQATARLGEMAHDPT